jgi:hypothetical protein
MLLPLFFEIWSDPAWQWSLQRAIRYYADAAVMGTLERNIVLAQVALESLAIAHRANSPQQPQAGRRKPPASQPIRQLLVDLGIPTAIPRAFSGLRKIEANAPWDGPAAIAWLRNDIVHANRRVDARHWELWHQGWRLALWYLELSVLAMVKYNGRYRNRLVGELHVGAVEQVPWAGRVAAAHRPKAGVGPHPPVRSTTGKP